MAQNAGGNAGANASRDLGKEISEEFGKELARVTEEAATLGKSGADAAAWCVGHIDWGKIFAKGGAHGVTSLLMEKIVAHAGITDPVTRAMLQIFVGGTVAGGAEQGIDKMAAFFNDPNKRAGAIGKAIENVMPTSAKPNAGIVAVTYQQGSRGSAFTHRAKTDSAGVIIQFPGQSFANTLCDCMAVDFAFHDVAHPTTAKGGGKDNKGNTQPTVVTQGKRFLVDQPTDIATALRSKPVLCLQCFPLGAASVAAAPKAKTFWQRADESEAVKTCLAALRRHAATSSRPHIAVDHMEDVEKLDFDALRLLCESLVARVVEHVDDSGGTRRVMFYEMDDSTAKEFVLGLDSIGTELKFSNKVEETAHNAWATFKHEIAHASGWDKAAACAVLAIPAIYVLSAVPIIVVYGAGIFGWWQNQTWNVGLTLAGALLALLWLIPWYSMEGIGRFFGGFFHVHADEHDTPTLANTARNITALLFGIGVTAILVSDLGLAFGFGTFYIRFALISAIVLALIGYDRIGARWGHDSEEIHHLLERLSLNNIRTLAAVATVLAVIGIGPLAYLQYVESSTKFALAVEKGAVDGNDVYFVPTPDGRLFRPADIFGLQAAAKIEEKMKTDDADRSVICLADGTDIDVPGYTEKWAGECVLSGEDKGGQLAIRANPFGWRFGGSAMAYDTLEALYLASRREEQELKAVLESELASTPGPLPITQPPAPEPTIKAVATPVPANTQTKSKATGGSPIDCSQLSPRARSRQPGCH
jgi:hypothetical protein